MKVVAIVPAAGLSQRMGTAKLALPLGSRKVLEHVVGALLSAGLDDVVVVLGKTSAPLAPLVHPPARTLLLDRDTPDMRTTVSAALRDIAERETMTDEDAFLLAPADQPTLSADITRDLVEAHRLDPTKIRVPVHAGKRGHPVLFPWFIVREVVTLAPNEGLDVLVRRRPDRVCEHVSSRPEILDDMDVPADYERLRRLPWM